MDAYDVEPVGLLCSRAEELDLAISERSEEPLVANIAHAVECQFGAPLLQKHGLDLNVIRLVSAAVVVDESAHL